MGSAHDLHGVCGVLAREAPRELVPVPTSAEAFRRRPAMTHQERSSGSANFTCPWRCSARRTCFAPCRERPSFLATVRPSIGRSNISSKRRPLGDGSRSSSPGSSVSCGMMGHVSPRGVARHTITRFPLFSASPNDSNAASDRYDLFDGQARIHRNLRHRRASRPQRQKAGLLGPWQGNSLRIRSHKSASTDSGVSLIILR